MEMLRIIKTLFTYHQPITERGDHKLYHIATLSNNYCGRIAHQDEVMIKLQSKNGKPVKILKENIRSMVVL